MTDIVSPGTRSQLRHAARLDEAELFVVRRVAVVMSNLDARAILDCIDTVAGIQSAMSQGKLTQRYIRILMEDLTTETVDITDRIPEITKTTAKGET